jgi:hypothetical protein
MTLEGDLQDRIRLALNDPEGVWWRNNLGTALLNGGARVRYGIGNPGGADLIGIFRGRFVAIEVKRPGRKQTPDQRMFQDLVERKRGIYAVVRSVEEAEAAEVLETLRRSVG